MIGRADIEGSKSNVAINAWLPQASYPCGNFYDTSSFKFQRSKRSIGHAFTPNSPPDNVFRPDRPAEADLGSKKRGCALLPIHGISKITLKVVVFQFRPRAPTYPTPLKSFHKVGLESSSTWSSFPADYAKPMCKCRSHGTFPLFGLQSSHLNICYYHQDLHRRPLRPGSRLGFYGDRRALLLIGAWPLPLLGHHT
ncbi:hypothetical protein V6N13_009987 [Hibiscus sabdariffa]